MESYISTETESGLLKLAGYQIIGGSLGLLLVGWGFYKSENLEGATIIMFLLMASFFAFSFFCGIRCIQATRDALKLSFINQLLQLVGFNILGFGFQYVAGLYLTVQLVVAKGLTFDWGFGISNLKLSAHGESEALFVSFNIIALIVIVWISRLRKRMNMEMELRNTSAIGDN